jgi:hypothetical protein
MSSEQWITLSKSRDDSKRRCPGGGGDSLAVENWKREESRNEGVWELV